MISEGMMGIFAEFGGMTDEAPESEKVQMQVRKLQDYITKHFYTCTKEILDGLGKMYGAGGEFTENIDKALRFSLSYFGVAFLKPSVIKMAFCNNKN